MNIEGNPYFSGDYVKINPTNPKAFLKSDKTFLVHSVEDGKVQLADEIEKVEIAELLPDHGLTENQACNFTVEQNSIARDIIDKAFNFVIFPAEENTFERYRTALEYAISLAGDAGFAGDGERATLRSRLISLWNRLYYPRPC